MEASRFGIAYKVITMDPLSEGMISGAMNDSLDADTTRYGGADDRSIKIWIKYLTKILIEDQHLLGPMVTSHERKK